MHTFVPFHFYGVKESVPYAHVFISESHIFLFPCSIHQVTFFLPCRSRHTVQNVLPENAHGQEDFVEANRRKVAKGGALTYTNSCYTEKLRTTFSIFPVSWWCSSSAVEENGRGEGKKFSVWLGAMRYFMSLYYYNMCTLFLCLLHYYMILLSSLPPLVALS